MDKLIFAGKSEFDFMLFVVRKNKAIPEADMQHLMMLFLYGER